MGKAAQQDEFKIGTPIAYQWIEGDDFPRGYPFRERALRNIGDKLVPLLADAGGPVTVQFHSDKIRDYGPCGPRVRHEIIVDTRRVEMMNVRMFNPEPFDWNCVAPTKPKPSEQPKAVTESPKPKPVNRIEKFGNRWCSYIDGVRSGMGG